MEKVYWRSIFERKSWIRIPFAALESITTDAFQLSGYSESLKFAQICQTCQVAQICQFCSELLRFVVVTTYMEGISVHLSLAASRPSPNSFFKKTKRRQSGQYLFNHQKRKAMDCLIITKKGTLISIVQVTSQKVECGFDDSERELDWAL